MVNLIIIHLFDLLFRLNIAVYKERMYKYRHLNSHAIAIIRTYYYIVYIAPFYNKISFNLFINVVCNNSKKHDGTN